MRQQFQFWEGITSQMVQTRRLKVHVLSAGPQHGHLSSWSMATAQPLRSGGSSCWRVRRASGASRQTCAAMATPSRCPVRCDSGLRRHGRRRPRLVEALHLGRYHLGRPQHGRRDPMKCAIARPADLLSLTLVDTMSPYGYSGCKGWTAPALPRGRAPAGAGSVNPTLSG